MISIVCPVHNEEDNISQLIESLLSQTAPIKEIIFINDSSTDKTYDIIKKYQKKNRFIRVKNVLNRNISKNRNLGIKMARSPWIAFIDAGCTIGPNYIAELKKCSLNNSDSLFFGGITKIPFRNNFEKSYSLLLERNPNHNYLPKGHAFFIKKDLFRKIGNFNESVLAAEDTDLILRAKKVGQFPIICENAIVYWGSRKNLKSIRRQFFNYGYWDGRSNQGLSTNARLTITFCIIFPLAILYSIFFSFRKTHQIRIFFMLMTMNLIKMYSYSIGAIRGMI